MLVMRYVSKTAAVLLFILLTVFCLSMPVCAADSCRIDVQLVTDVGAASGVTIRLYQVARETDGGMVQSQKFEDYSVDVNVTDGDDMTALATTLFGYVLRDDVSEDDAFQLDTEGRGAFTGLDSGVYLILGDDFSRGNRDYTVNPVVVRLPYTEKDGSFGYSASLDLKYGAEDRPGPSDDDSKIDISVEKRWAGDSTQDRPEQVQVQLLRNGRVYDTVILNDGNDWTYVWHDLSDAYRYLITEQAVPKGYTVDITQDGRRFVVTNTLSDWEEIPEEPEDTPNDIPEEPEDTPEDTPEDIPENTPGDEPDDVPGDTPEDDSTGLPQTGQQWLAVFVLAGLGFVLMGAGFVLYRRRDP